MQKLKDLFDSKTTWATIGIIAGSLFGGHGAEIANAIGAAVMVIL